MKVLVIAAHADDETIGCGGTIARHAAAGDEVHVLLVSEGVLIPREVVDSILHEMYAAHRLLGVTQTYRLRFPAPKLDTIPGHELADQINQILRSLQPEIIYTPHRGDLHGDHRAVYYASLVAARPIDNCSVRKVLSFETLSETDWAPPSGEDAFVPTVFVDITGYLEVKLQAIACYRSQLKEPPHTRSLRSVEALARLRGGTVNVQAAEAFMLVREIVD